MSSHVQRPTVCHRHSQIAESSAQDLAQNGPFHYFSSQSLKGDKKGWQRKMLGGFGFKRLSLRVFSLLCLLPPMLQNGKHLVATKAINFGFELH